MNAADPVPHRRRDVIGSGPTTAAVATADPAHDRPGRRDARYRNRWSRPWLWATAAYLACSLWLTRGVWGAPTDRWIGVGGDPQAFMWWLEWVPHALGNGLNPLHPTVVQYPEGVNALWNTSILLPGLIFAPVTAAFGPVLSWNLIHAGAPVAAALVAMAALGRFVDRRLPAFVGGLVYGFSPYVTLKMLVHTNLVITVLPPLILLCVHELFVRRRRSPVVVGVVLGLSLTAQLLTGEEFLLISVLVATLAAAVLALLVRRVPDVPWRDGMRGLAVAAAVALVTAAPFLAFQFFGPRSARCCVPGVSKYALDLQTLVVPSPFQFFHTGDAYRISRQWQGIDESNAYIGVAMLAFLVVAVVALRRRRAVQVSAIVLVALVTLAVGVEVHVAGAGTGVPGPWRVLQHLPVLGNVVVGRFMSIGYLAIGLIVAVALDTTLDRRPTLATRATIGATLVAVASLAPASALVTTDHTPAFFSDTAAVRRLLGDDAVVITSPYFEADAMRWQATAGFRYSMVNGALFHPGPDGAPVHNGPLLGVTQRLHELGSSPDGGRTAVTAAERDQYLGELADHGVTAVVVGPSPGRTGVETFLAEVTGSDGSREGGVTVFTVGR